MVFWFKMPYMRRKNCILLPAAGRRTQLFHPIFTEPGVHLLGHPCTLYLASEKSLYLVGEVSRHKHEQTSRTTLFCGLWVTYHEITCHLRCNTGIRKRYDFREKLSDTRSWELRSGKTSVVTSNKTSVQWSFLAFNPNQIWEVMAM